MIAPLANEFFTGGGVVFPLDDQDYGAAVHLGLTGYSPDGKAVLHLLGRRFTDGVHGPFGRLAYVSTGPNIAIIDLRRQRLLRLSRMPNPDDQIFPVAGWQTRPGGR
jgi:hypothetical protein